MSKQDQVERGDEVLHEVTGLKGIVTGEEINLQGVRRVDINAGLDKDGKMHDTWTVDENNVKILKKQKLKQLPPVIGENDANLGDEVEDTVSGFKGVVTAIGMSLNGCRRCCVQPKVDKEGKLPDMKGFDIGRLKVLKTKKIPEGQRQTGSDMTKSGAW